MDTTAPYTFDWTGVAVGTYSLTARATDNKGATATSAPVSVTVEAANVPPTVSITNPTEGATLTAPATITIAADANDADGAITQVEFFQGATSLNVDTTAPYTFDWTGVAAGTYSLTAKATDDDGAVTTSAAVNVTVEAVNVPPTVSITGPTDGAVFTVPTTFTINATATDADGTVQKVEFFEGANKIGEDNTPPSPFSISWSPAEGTYVLTAKATDDEGATTTSAAVNITVNPPPTLGITAPGDGALYTAPADITINAAAAGAVTQVEFFAGANSIGVDTTGPLYSVTWTAAPAGNYALTAVVTDTGGGTATSAPVNIIVNAPPTLTITAPAGGVEYIHPPVTIVIEVTASDGDGTITKVEFFKDGVKIGEDTTNNYTCTVANLTGGTYVLTATATDNHGATTPSDPITVTVKIPPGRGAGSCAY